MCQLTFASDGRPHLGSEPSSDSFAQGCWISIRYLALIRIFVSGGEH